MNQRNKEVTFLTAIKDFFNGYFKFSGYTTRAGYWKVVLVFALIFSIVAVLLFMQFSNMLITIIERNSASAFSRLMISLSGYAIIFIIIYLALFLPFSTLFVRRLQDIGFTLNGSLVLWAIFLFIGLFVWSTIGKYSSIIQIILCCLPSDQLIKNNPKANFFLREKH